MSSDKVFEFISDPGHGWLKVKDKDLIDVGLWAPDFSSYSYRSGNTFYLEEDCDAAIFVRAFEAKHGRKPAYVERYVERTHIRGLPRIR
jgi:hypothetical protein